MIELIRADRAGECAAIHAESFAYPWSVSEFESLLAASNCVADGAIDPANGNLLGFVLARKAADEAEILTIAVSRSVRRHGIGGLLLDGHVKALEAARVARLFLEVDEGNAAALALYAAKGFEQVGERKNYYRQAGGAGSGARVLCLRIAR